MSLRWHTFQCVCAQHCLLRGGWVRSRAVPSNNILLRRLHHCCCCSASVWVNECDVACSIRISDETIVIYRGGQFVATSSTLNYTFIWCTIRQLTFVQSIRWASMLLPKAQIVRTIPNCRECTHTRLRPPHSLVESEFHWVECEIETKWKEHKASAPCHTLKRTHSYIYK